MGAFRCVNCRRGVSGGRGRLKRGNGGGQCEGLRRGSGRVRKTLAPERGCTTPGPTGTVVSGSLGDRRAALG